MNGIVGVGGVWEMEVTAADSLAPSLIASVLAKHGQSPTALSLLTRPLDNIVLEVRQHLWRHFGARALFRLIVRVGVGETKAGKAQHR